MTERLAGGDFDVAQPRKNDWAQEVGPIKASGWPLLLQAGALARVDDKFREAVHALGYGRVM